MKSAATTSSLQLYTRVILLRSSWHNSSNFPPISSWPWGMVVVSLKFPPRRKLIIECVSHVMEAPEWILQERVKLVVGDSFEAGWQHSTEEKVIISVDCYFLLVLEEVQEGIRGSRIVVESDIMNFFGKQSMVISFDSGESEGLSLLYSIPFKNG